MNQLIQGTCVLVGAGAVLIRGRPGSGKSTLAAALLATNGPTRLARLVGDDAVLASAHAGRLVVTVPAPTAGLIEARGVGLMETPHERRAVVRLIVDLVAAEAVERLPRDGAFAEVLGLRLPRVAMSAGDPANPVRVAMALAALASAGPARPAPERNHSAALQRNAIIRA